MWNSRVHSSRSP